MLFPHIFHLFSLRQYLRGCAMLCIQVFIDMMLLLYAVVILASYIDLLIFRVPISAVARTFH